MQNMFYRCRFFFGHRSTFINKPHRNLRLLNKNMHCLSNATDLWQNLFHCWKMFSCHISDHQTAGWHKDVFWFKYSKMSFTPNVMVAVGMCWWWWHASDLGHKVWNALFIDLPAWFGGETFLASEWLSQRYFQGSKNIARRGWTRINWSKVQTFQ